MMIIFDELKIINISAAYIHYAKWKVHTNSSLYNLFQEFIAFQLVIR